ncbi:hypothetical protein Hdeb2414_s0002g00053051 [Helianthus debilis subsp. tardiflorus]
MTIMCQLIQKIKFCHMFTTKSSLQSLLFLLGGGGFVLKEYIYITYKYENIFVS